MGFNFFFVLPVTLPSVVPRLATDAAVRVFPGVWKLLSFKTPFPGRISILFCLSFCLKFFSYFLLKTMGCFSGYLMSSAGIQKLFCGISSAFKCSFDECVREKVISLFYSSAILGPPLEKTLESPLDCKEIQPVLPKGDQSWVFTGRTDAEAETPILWPPDVKS